MKNLCYPLTEDTKIDFLVICKNFLKTQAIED